MLAATIIIVIIIIDYITTMELLFPGECMFFEDIFFAAMYLSLPLYPQHLAKGLTFQSQN